VGRIGGMAPAGLNPALRIYSYAVGEVFGAHYYDSTDTSLVGRDLGTPLQSPATHGLTN